MADDLTHEFLGSLEGSILSHSLQARGLRPDQVRRALEITAAGARELGAASGHGPPLLGPIGQLLVQDVGLSAENAQLVVSMVLPRLLLRLAAEWRGGVSSAGPVEGDLLSLLF